MNKSLNIAIACGGTGGHLFPGIAVAEELKKRGHNPILIVSEKKVDQEASAKYKQFTFVTQPSRPKPATAPLKMAGFILSLFKTVSQSKKLYKSHNVNAVLGMGGFTCFGPVYAGKSMQLPTFLHESNAIPGKTNRFLSKWVHKVLLGLEEASSYFGDTETEVVGTPLRDEMKTLPSREAAAAKYNLDPNKKTVLVFGGSQGAQKLNTLVSEAFDAMQTQVLHVAGTFDYDRIKSLAEQKVGYTVIPFCDDMPAAYAVSDFVICRSGASSLTELSYLGLPSLLVPYPVAADDHQTKNAEAFSEKDAAILKQEKDLTADSLAKLVKETIENTELMTSLSTQIKALSEDPAGRIADLLEKTAPH